MRISFVSCIESFNSAPYFHNLGIFADNCKLTFAVSGHLSLRNFHYINFFPCVHVCVCPCISDELVDWDPWQPAAAAAVMDGGDDSAPHCDDPNFNVSQPTYSHVIF